MLFDISNLFKFFEKILWKHGFAIQKKCCHPFGVFDVKAGIFQGFLSTGSDVKLEKCFAPRSDAGIGVITAQIVG